MADAERIVAGFARALRANGLSVPTGTAVLFAEALALVGVDSPSQVYWAGRATLVRRGRGHRRLRPGLRRLLAGPAATTCWPPQWPSTPLTLAVDEDDDEEPDAEVDDDPTAPEGDVLTVRYSAVEVLRQQDLSALTAEEWAEAQRLISALGDRVRAAAVPADPAVAAPVARPSRPARHRPAQHAHRGHPDPAGLAGAGRAAPAAGASCSTCPGAWSRTPGVWPASPTPRSRRGGPGRVEVFTIGTRLTRITRELARRDPDAALAVGGPSRCTTGRAAPGSGASLQEFNDEWGVRGMARGAVVVICSDGWDRGDPALIGVGDGPPVAGGPPGGVGQPAEGVPRVRPAGPRDGCGPAVC